MDIENVLLRLTEEKSPSEIHIRGGMPIYARIMGELQKVEEAPSIDESREFLSKIMSDTRMTESARDIELRWRNFRVAVYRERGKTALVFRPIGKIPLLEELGQVDVLDKFVNTQSGIIIIASGIGEGKTTTAFSFLNEILLNRSIHLMTLEDPVEYILPRDLGIVTQRSKGRDYKSTGASILHAMKNDVDVLYVSDIYCLEDIEACVSMAEAGRLVIFSIRSKSVVNTLQKIIHLYPNRERLAEVLKLIVVQELCVSDGKVSTVAEILTSTDNVKRIITNGNITDLNSIMEKGEHDMQTISMGIKKL